MDTKYFAYYIQEKNDIIINNIISVLKEEYCLMHSQNINSQIFANIQLNDLNIPNDENVNYLNCLVLVKFVSVNDIFVKRSNIVSNFNRNDNVNDNENAISLEAVILYFKQNDFPDYLAKKFFEYYSVNDWKDSNGKKISSWKQKAQSVWFKEENKPAKPNPKTIHLQSWL